MKKYIKITTFIITICTFLISCNDDFLDIIPKGQQVAITTSDYDLLMNSPGFYQYGSGGLQVPMWLGDEIAANQSDLNNNDIQAQRLFRWDDIIYNSSDSNPLVWDLETGLGHIYVCNKIINEVMTSTEGTEEQKRILKAEALATRAMENFLLVNLYTKPYKAATAANDLGFPIITTADISVKIFPRGTVQESYDFIVNDLTTAIADLPMQNTFRTRMSKPAAKAFLGKVYLFMGRYNDALPLFDAAFTDLTATSNPPYLYDYNATFFDPGGAFLPIDTYTGPNSPGNNYNDITESVLAKICYTGEQNGNGPGNNGLAISPETAALYGANDFRLNFYAATYHDAVPNPFGLLRKYGVKHTRFGIELSELYLLSAECKARLNDLSGAVADVERLRKKRMPLADAIVPSAIATNQIDLIKFVLEERIREFAGQGYRWFDMRRLSVDPNPALAATVIITHTSYDSSNAPTIYTLRPERLVLRFPQSYINSNPGMVNNP
jgi:hypothetical protein